MSAFAPKDPNSLGFREILYGKQDFVAKVTINRPQVHNAFNTRTLEELAEAFKDASWDDSIAVVVLTGAGDKAFCTGGDVKEYQGQFLSQPRQYWKWMGLFIETLDGIRNLGKPVIARLNGIVAGGGNELNLACDLAIAASHVTIRQVGTRVGSVAAGGATQWLPLTIGDRRAREMLFTCDPVDAETALKWGLVNQVVPAEQLDQAVDQLCDKIIDKFSECTRYTKQQLNFWKDLSWHSTIGHAREWLSLHYALTEPWEGMNAFIEKRQPDYRGLRHKAAQGSSEFLWGPYTHNCGQCGARGIPRDFRYCGSCGTELTAAPSGPNEA